jgi:hypothetical protein
MKISLILEREVYTDKSTIGKLYYKDLQVIYPKFICYTLEDTCRDWNRDGDLDDKGEAKVFGETAIPSGTYEMEFRYSPGFKINTPHLLNVKDYKYILIHPGNGPKDSKGCILVGKNQSKDWISESRLAFKELMFLLKKYSEMEITIVDKKIIPLA